MISEAQLRNVVGLREFNRGRWYTSKCAILPSMSLNILLKAIWLRATNNDSLSLQYLSTNTSVRSVTGDFLNNKYNDINLITSVVIYGQRCETCEYFTCRSQVLALVFLLNSSTVSCVWRSPYNTWHALVPFYDVFTLIETET